ncbi:MAG: hypothetical protein M1827_001899 [Pycnora praestabilis]|nr:MAG: hypothetical protein M1827_001899 [Pycnora praestabilis]
MAEQQEQQEAVIRHATKEDVPTILQLIHELAAYEHATHEVLATESSLLSTLTFSPSPPSSTSTTTGTTTPASTGYAKTLLIIDAPTSTVAGMALYFYNYSTWRGAPGVYLEDLFVRPAHRRKGYGRLLLGALAKEVLRVGGARLDWSVLKWNQPSIEFYEGLGAKMMGEWVGMRVEGEGLVALTGKGSAEGRGEEEEEGDLEGVH